MTLREVARLAGVHPGTASRALNERKRSLLAPATVERVEAAASSLGYRPNYLARSFKTRRTLSIGVLVPDLNNPLFPPIVRGVEDRLAEDGYVALLANTDNDDARAKRILEEMGARQVEGLILATARREDPMLVALARSGMPLALVNRVVDDHAFSSVSPDDQAGIRLLVGHLTGLGHRRIAHIAAPQSLSTGFGRLRGFRSAMAEAGLEVAERHVAFAGGFSVAEGLRATRELLASRPRPTAIVAGNDMLALGCYSALAEAGLECPGDVAVVGFNDMPFVDRLAPPLTSIRIPHAEIGRLAAELVLERIAEPAAPLKVLLVRPELVLRGSTAPPLQRARAARATRAAG